MLGWFAGLLVLKTLLKFLLLAMAGFLALRVFLSIAVRTSATSFCASWRVRVGELY